MAATKNNSKNGSWQRHAMSALALSLSGLIGFTANIVIRGQDKADAAVELRVRAVEEKLSETVRTQQGRGERIAKNEAEIHDIQRAITTDRSRFESELTSIRRSLERLEDLIRGGKTPWR